MRVKDIANVCWDFHNGFEPIRAKTRFKDKDNKPIYIGDWIHVEGFKDYDYEGRVEWEEDWNGKPIVAVVYYDIGEREGTPLTCFPKKFRRILTEEEKERL